MISELTSSEKGMMVVKFADAGIAMKKQALRRQYGDAQPGILDRELQKWLLKVNDPMPGDVAGRVRIRYRAL